MAPSIDEFEDLTQFADESFDTEEVDLFEFADDEDSPLLRLKSIVLSLDWDITEEILTELNEELASLRALWKDDKVAQIYLQGMENVGKYMQAEGAYAHPNAIKLLLTLYHNYEKIISSPNISSQSITAMLKADIRKFKVLQYQISSLKNASGGGQEEPPAEPAAKELPAAAKPTPSSKPTPVAAAAAKPTAQDSGVPGPLRSMEATILGLEWEVTDEGLEKFSKESTELRSHLSGNKEAQVLIQGLQALGAYIREQKTNAHPDSFTILHSFYDALKMLLESPQLGAEQRRHILLEQIGSLNSLKEVIARSAASKQEEAEEEEPEEPESDAAVAEEDAPAEDEAGFSFDDADDAVPAAPSRPAAPPEPAAGGGDEDDEFGDDLFSSGGGVVPALADADEEGGFSDNFAAAGLGAERTAELDEKLDSFFNFDDELDNKAEPPKKAAESKQTATPPAKSSLAHIFDDAPDDEDDDSAELDSSFFNFDDELDEAPVAAAETETEDEDTAVSFADDDSIFDSESEETFPESSLAGKEKRQSLSAAVEQGDDDEEDDELDSFFNFDSEQDELPPVKAKVKPAVPATAEDEPADLFGGDDEDGPVAAALADEQEQSAAEEDDEDELGSDFETFFSFDEDDGAAPPKGKTAATPAVEEEPEDVLSMDKGLFGGDEDTDSGPAAALADEEERPDAEDDDEDDAAATPKGKTAAIPVADEEPEDVLSMDKGLFGGDEETDSGPAAALADEEERPDAEDDDEADTLDSGSLDSFFSFDEDDAAATPKGKTPAVPATAEEPDSGPAAALADEEERPDAEDDDEADTLDSGSLDSFFSFDEDDAAAPPKGKTAAAPAVEEEPEDVLSMDKGLFGGDEDSDSGPAAALADEEERPDAKDDDEADTLDSGSLDSFFSFDEDDAATTPQGKTAAVPVAEEEPEDVLSMDKGLFGGDEDTDSGPAAALADEEERPEAEEDDEADTLDSGSLDSFFSFDEDDAATTPKGKTAAVPVVEEEPEIGSEKAAEIKSKLDSLFSFEDDALTEQLATDSQNDMPELDDDLITPLDDDEPSEKISDKNLFGADELSIGDAEAEPVTEEPTVVAADSLTAEQEDDSFFGSDSEADAAEAEPALNFAENEEADSPATEEAFFSFAANDDDGFDEKADAASDEELAIQDEPFGLTEMEEPQAAKASNLADEQGDDSFFNFDSGLNSIADAAETEPVLDVAENGEEESPATEEAFFSFAANDDDGFGEKTEAASDEEPAMQDEPFGLTEMEEPQAVEANNLADEQGDDSFFGFDSGLSGDVGASDSSFAPDFSEHGGDEEDVSAAEETEELAVAALTDDAEEDLLLDKEYEAESQALFFGQDDLPDPFASSGAEPAEEEAAEDEPVSAELDDHGAVVGGTAFASLAAAASALPELPSSAQLRQFAELASAARREAPLSAQQSIVLNLLDSSAALLAQAPECAAGGGVVMQDLASALERAEEPETLAEAVSRYTAWQQDFFAGLLRRRPQMPEATAQDDSLGLMREEFSQLKQELLTEFSQLRKEMRTMLRS